MPEESVTGLSTAPSDKIYLARSKEGELTCDRAGSAARDPIERSDRLGYCPSGRQIGTK